MTLAALGRAFILTLSCITVSVSAAPHPYVVDVQISMQWLGSDYYTDLLHLILNASKAPDEIIELRALKDTDSLSESTQARLATALVQNKGNRVMSMMNSLERQKSFRAIPIPLFKGLMGYRALVIRKSDEAKFAKIKTKEALLALVAGQGMHWPDTEILRANQFKVTEALGTKYLYKMLQAKRFDFFPRGINEVDLEIDLINTHNLMIEPHLILHYPADSYFFVDKENTELAQRLEKGFDIIHKNGTFDKLFLNTEQVKYALKILKQPNKIVIELNNPLLPSDTPLHTPGYWLKFSTLP